MGMQSGPYAWPQILESTAATLAARFTDDELRLQSYDDLIVLEARVHRHVAAATPGSAKLWEELAQIDPNRSDRRDAMRARLLRAGGAGERLDEVLADVDPGFSRSETVRSIIEVAAALDRDLDPGWIETALASGWFAGHAAHILPALTDPDRRAQVADSIIERVNAEQAPAWWLALVVSQVAPHASGAVGWELDVLDPDGLWKPHIAMLHHAVAADSHEALLRAHPFREFFDRIRRPHEFTHGVASRMLDRHGGAAPLPEAPVPPPAEVTMPPAEVPMPPADRPMPPADLPIPDLPLPPAEVPPPMTAAPADNRRLGVGFAEELPLVAGKPATLEVSIAPPGKAPAQVGEPIEVEFPPGVEERSLPVRLVGGGIDAVEMMTLDRHPTTTGKVTFTVTPTGTTFRGYVLVYNELYSAMLQAAEVTAAVVAAAGAIPEGPELELRLVDAGSLVLSPLPTSANLLATADGQLVGRTPGVSIPAATSAVIAETDGLVTGLVAAGSHHLDAGRSPAPTIRAAARIGARLRTELGLDPLNDYDHIQMVSFSKQTVFPLDLVYGGPRPDADAEPCEQWKAALETAARRQGPAEPCAGCEQRDEDAGRRVVCPLRFWGLSKVIEHQWPEGTPSGNWVARVHRGCDDQSTTAITNILTGASALVMEETGAADAATALASVSGAVPQGVTVAVAEDWTAWRNAVASGPALLVALPHHDQVMEDLIPKPALEIGGEASVIEEYLVRPPDSRPGPLVLLLGCNTGIEHERVLSFASVFRSYSPVVVATVGEVIAQEAPVIAEHVVRELIAAASDGRTVGEAVRDARRTLMAQDRPVALQLLLHGDSEWRIGQAG
jgi:hypothetical protein